MIKLKSQKHDCKPINKIVFIIIFILILGIKNVWAVAYTSIANGNWNDQTIWNDGVSGFPDGIDDTATVMHTVTITADVTSGAVQVNNGGEIRNNTGGVTWTVRGDITVSGTLTLGANTSTRINCGSPVQYGIIIENGGTFNAIGNSSASRDCVITAVNSSNNTYIWIKDGTETVLQYCNISEMGTYTTYGLHVEDIDSSVVGERIFIDYCNFSNFCYAIAFSGSNNNNAANNGGIFYNNFFGNVSYQIMVLYSSDNNTISNNTSSAVIYGSSAGVGVCLDNSHYNLVDSNILFDSNTGSHTSGILINYSSSHNTVTNNECYNNSIGIALFNGANNNHVNNNICHDNILGSSAGFYFSDNITDNNFVNNKSYNNVSGLICAYHSSTNNTFTDCLFGTDGISNLPNTTADINFVPYLNYTLILDNCKFDSPTEISGLFDDPGTWVVSKSHDQNANDYHCWSGTDGMDWNEASLPPGVSDRVFIDTGTVNVNSDAHWDSLNCSGKIVIDSGMTLTCSNTGTAVVVNNSGEIEINGTGILETEGSVSVSGILDMNSTDGVGSSQLKLDGIDHNFSQCVFDDSGTYDVTVDNDADLIFYNSTRGNVLDNYLDTNSSILWLSLLQAPVINLTSSDGGTTMPANGKAIISGSAEPGMSIYSVEVKDQQENILNEGITVQVDINAQGGISGELDLGGLERYLLVSAVKVEIAVRDGFDNRSAPGVSNYVKIMTGRNKITPYNNVFDPHKGERCEIRIELLENTRVELKLYNLVGDLVRVLVNEEKQAGTEIISWDGRNNCGDEVASGTYLLRIEAGRFKDTKKICIIK